ncbi:MAG TPA: STAS-like domain-containing protein [Williamwhitmania sp.]|nr:STAS-like domain-containing protein [Williamwhitmania sp.]
MKTKPKITLSVADEFSRTPGPRYEVEGDFSGESFRKSLLFPKLNKTIQDNSLLEINLDGTAGYGTSFLEEAFGGLIRHNKLNRETIKNSIQIISDEEEYLIDDIEKYLDDAAREAI